MEFQTCYSKYSEAICISESPLLEILYMEKITKLKLDQVREVGKVYFETGKIPES